MKLWHTSRYNHMKQALTYSLKVWLTTITVSPLLLYLTGILVSHTPLNQEVADSLLWFVPAFALFGALLSSPLYLAFRMVALVISRKSMNPRQMKLWLSAIVVVLSIVGFCAFTLLLKFLPPYRTEWATLIMSVPYILTAVMSVWFYRLDATNFKTSFSGYNED